MMRHGTDGDGPDRGNRSRHILLRRARAVGWALCIGLLAAHGSVSAAEDWVGSSKLDRAQIESAVRALGAQLPTFEFTHANQNVLLAQSGGAVDPWFSPSLRSTRQSKDSAGLTVLTGDPRYTTRFFDGMEADIAKNFSGAFTAQRQQIGDMPGLMAVGKQMRRYECEAIAVYQSFVFIGRSESGCPQAIKYVEMLRSAVQGLTHQSDPVGATPDAYRPPQPGEMPLPPGMR
jgi:hypothetical protein